MLIAIKKSIFYITKIEFYYGIKKTQYRFKGKKKEMGRRVKFTF